jgi:hypothetical protein
MKHQKTLLALALIACATVTGTAQASLVGRGNGMLYDNVLNVTWLQDANYAKTSGYDADGQMYWNAATTWAANLVYGGFSDWRLATNTPVSGGASFNIGGNGYDGTTDYGFNITSPKSELAYMYNVNLGLKDYYSATNVYQPTFGVFGNGTYNGVNQNSIGQADVGLVKNLQSYAYWSGAEYSPGSGNAWYFNTTSGNQSYNYGNGLEFYAWAVRPGDVSAVPVPAAFWLFGSGLMGLLGLRRRGNIG